MKLRIAPALFGLLLPLVPAASALSAPTVPVDKLEITSISYSGSGCPDGSASYTWTDDSSLFELLFSQYVATLGPGIPESESRKECTITVTLHVPDGYEPWVRGVEYDGYAQLDPGVVANRAAAYSLTGEPPEPHFRDLILDGEYQITDQMAEPQCRPGHGNQAVTQFTMKTHARLKHHGKKGDASGILTVDDAAGGVATEKWQLALHRCN